MTSGAGLILDLILPVPLIALLAVLLLFFTVRVYWSVGSSIGRWRNGALLFFRLAGLGLVLVLLLQPSRLEFLPPPTRDRLTLIGLDSSLSMKQRDAGERTRFDASKDLLLDSGALTHNGRPADPHLRFFEFSDDARSLQQSVLDLAPAGKTTLFDKSVGTMLSAPANDEAVNALILLTDGHDFEMVNPVKTGLLAHDRRTSIYAVALGRQGKVRDVAARITRFQPYCYVKQKARIHATLRLVGCELEDLTVQLLRQGQVAQTKRVNAQQLQELPVEFEVAEPAAGQYEYEVRVLPLENEADTANNSAITYLNVIDQQIRVLLLEGDPYWDTTFLQRSLMRNDKFDVDALIRYGPNRVRAIRKTPGGDELRAPQTLDQFAAYDVIEYAICMRTFAAMNFDVLNIGSSEAQFTAAQVRDIKSNLPSPIISANLLDKSSRQPILDSYRIVQRGAYRVGIIGVLDPRAAENPGDGLAVGDMESAIERCLAQLQGNADLIVLLAFADEAALGRLAQEFYECKVILGGKVTQPAQELVRQNRSVIYFVTNESRALGILRLRLARGTEMEVTANEIRLLHDQIPQDASIHQFMQSYRDEIRRARLAVDDPNSLDADAVAGVRTVASYVGTEICLACHKSAAAVWKDSAHARAFATLMDAKADADPKCVGCHMIGFGRFSGYRREFGADKLANVGCESCHGPGSLHVRQREGDRTVNFTFLPLGAGDCAKCHYGEFSRPFDWDQFWPAIWHGKEPASPMAAVE